MENYDKEFEEYLREFRPRGPQALPPRVQLPRLWRLAAAAAVAAAIGSSFWLINQKKTSRKVELPARKDSARVAEPAPRSLRMHMLTKMALDNPQELEARLAQASRQTLPDFRSSDSILRVLAKD